MVAYQDLSYIKGTITLATSLDSRCGRNEAIKSLTGYAVGFTVQKKDEEKMQAILGL